MARRGILSRHFVLLFAMTFLTFFAAFQLFPTVPLKLLKLGASVAESGRWLSVFTAGSALGALVTGPLGDRVGQRRMMTGCALLFAAFLGAYGFLDRRWAFFATAFPHGVVWSGLLTATMSTLGGILPEDRRANGMSIFGLASPAGIIVGPLLGTTLYHAWGFRAMVWSLGLLFAVLAALARTLPRDRPRVPIHHRFRLPEAFVLAPCTVFFATALGYGALSTYTVQEGEALGFPTVLGLLSTAPVFLGTMAFGMVLMRIYMNRRGFGHAPNELLPPMLLAAATGLALLAFLPGGIPRHVAAALVYGAGYSMVHTLLNAHVLEVVHPDRRGAAFGATLFAFDSGIGLGSLLIGSVIGRALPRFGPMGFRVGWATACLAALASLPLAFRMLRKTRSA